MFDDLKSHADRVADRHILSLFDDADRAQAFSVRAEGMLFDYSKTNLDAQTRDTLLGHAERAGVAARRDAMFAGEKINETEGRAVLHTALRTLDASVMVDGADVMPPVRDTLARMEAFASAIRTGEIGAPGGGRYTDVINIGIGGADLGLSLIHISQPTRP